MASTTAFTPLSLSSSSSLIDAKALPHRHQSQCLSMPALPPPPAVTTAYYCRRSARNVVAMATGEAPAEVVAEVETPEFLTTIQETWDKVDEKYAVISLVVAGGVVLIASAGMISAVDRLPLIPGILELVGIGYTGWFAYQNLFFQPNREALVEKIKCTYKDIIGTS